jgi:hypothetical protein
VKHLECFITSGFFVNNARQLIPDERLDLNVAMGKEGPLLKADRDPRIWPCIGAATRLEI